MVAQISTEIPRIWKFRIVSVNSTKRSRIQSHCHWTFVTRECFDRSWVLFFCALFSQSAWDLIDDFFVQWTDNFIQVCVYQRMLSHEFHIAESQWWWKRWKLNLVFWVNKARNTHIFCHIIRFLKQTKLIFDMQAAKLMWVFTSGNQICLWGFSLWHFLITYPAHCVSAWLISDDLICSHSHTSNSLYLWDFAVNLLAFRRWSKFPHSLYARIVYRFTSFSRCCNCNWYNRACVYLNWYNMLWHLNGSV